MFEDRCCFVAKMMMRRTARRMIMKTMNDDATDQASVIIMPRTSPTVIFPLFVKFVSNVVAAPSRQSASAGLKSKLPMTSHLIPWKMLRYGSHIFARKRANPLEETLGTHVRIILMKQSKVYMETSAAKTLKMMLIAEFKI